MFAQYVHYFCVHGNAEDYQIFFTQCFVFRHKMNYHSNNGNDCLVSCSVFEFV